MGDPAYDADFYRWTQVQARRLREGPRGSNALDYDNLAEEIADLGKRDLRELLSRLGVLVEHLLKLQASPAETPRAGWKRTVRTQRREIARLLETSPSLGEKLAEPTRDHPSRLAAAIAEGWREARAGLSESDGVETARLPELPDWPLDTLLDERWMPGEHA